MKLGISQTLFALPKEWTLERFFLAAKAAGFDGVELALTEDGDVNLHSTVEDMQKVKALAVKCGIELYSLTSLLCWDYPLTSNDSAVRDKAKSVVKKQIELAHYLGCDTVLVVPGYVGVDFVPGSEVVDYVVAYERATAVVEELKAYAEEMQVSVGIENVWNKFLLSPLEMRDFIDKAASSYVGSYFDVGNVLYSGYPEQWVKILGSRIKKVHFKDFKRSIGTIDGFVDLLEGDVNYPAVMKALQEVGYDGWVTAEVGYPAEEVEAGLAKTIAAMKRIVEM